MSSGETCSRETLLFVDFNDKLSSELLQNIVFLRLANLEEENPLVQVNDLIFKGTYHYSIGTNLFFTKTPNEGPSEFPFKDSTKFRLDFMNSQTKVLRCTQMKIPTNVAQLPANQENIKFNFKWDYKELLKKLEKGELDLQDMVAQRDDPQRVVEVPEIIIDRTVTAEDTREVTTPLESMEICDDTTISTANVDVAQITEIEDPIKNERYTDLENAYENLQLLARTPVKRDIGYEDPQQCDPKFKSEYEYKSIECKVLEPPLFCYKKFKIKEKTFEDCVNLNRCVTFGLLPPSDNYPRTLSEEEKNKIMKVENFENLDLNARYAVLVSLMKELEKQVNLNSPEQNCVKDEFDRTPVETLDIFRRLVLSLKRRIQEIDMCR